MARYSIRQDTAPVLNAASEWRDKCLLGNGSVFSDVQLWTLDYLNALDRFYIQHYLDDDRTFYEKLKEQIEPAPPEAVKLMAEMLWVMFLFPRRMRGIKKREDIRTVWSWSGESLPENHPFLQAPLENGIGVPGVSYGTHRWRELTFFIRTMQAWKREPHHRQSALIEDPWGFSEWLTAIPEAQVRLFRHILLYLLFPDTYESIASGNVKREILHGYSERLAESAIQINEELLENLTEVDKTLVTLRKKLEAENPGKEVVFYDAPYKEQWGAKDGSVNFTIRGVRFKFSPEDVSTAVEVTTEEDWRGKSGIEPHYHLVVGPDSKPVKAVFRNMQEVPEDFVFTSHEAARVFKRLGFDVVDTADVRVSAIFDFILSEYVKTRESERFGGSGAIAERFRTLERLFTRSEPIKKRPSLKVVASYGRGNWANVPWVAFLDSRETNTTQQGVYVVFLFKEDMAGVYLTYNQGVTDLLKAEGRQKGYAELRQRAETVRQECTDLAEHAFRMDDSISLSKDAGLGQDYEASTIAHKLYEKGRIPQDPEILTDLEAVLSAYDGYLEKKTQPYPPVTEPPGDDVSSSEVEPIIELEAVVDAFSHALVESYVRFGEQHEQLVRSFVASLATKPLVILTGLSGSGKTQIGIKFGEWLGRERLHVAAVRPDWTGAEALFGYEDALKPAENGRPAWTVPETLAFLLRAAADSKYPYVLILDEMNLAHVERYFADVLSGMESGHAVLPNLIRGADGHWRIQEHADARIPFPNNVFVIGTVNIDETTYMFSPKVLDRANTFEFRVRTDDLAATYQKPLTCSEADPGLIFGFLEIASNKDWHLESGYSQGLELHKALRQIHALLSAHNFEFGHRTLYESMRFAALHEAAGDGRLENILDRIVMQKLLPRIHGSRRRIEQLLVALCQYCSDSELSATHDNSQPIEAFDPENVDPRSAKLVNSFDKLLRMLRSLRANQFTSFTE